MNNLFVRTLTGIVFLGVIVSSILLSKFSFALLFILIQLGALREFFTILKRPGNSPSYWLALASGTIIFLVFFLTGSGFLPSSAYSVLILLILLIFIVELFRKREQPFENIASSLLGLVYIVMPISITCLLVFTGKHEYKPEYLLALFTIIWTYDTGAYLFGITLGKHRLFERVSPKKSWEGAIGGTLLAIGASWLIASIFLTEIEWPHWIGIAVTTVVFATFGDLTESLLKRQFNLKDSSNFFPGHGGILDRFDSLFFAVPAVVVYFKLFI